MSELLFLAQQGNLQKVKLMFDEASKYEKELEEALANKRISSYSSPTALLLRQIKDSEIAYAANAGHFEVAEFLFSKVLKTDSIMSFAVLCGAKMKFVQYLLNKGHKFEVDAIFEAARIGNKYLFIELYQLALRNKYPIEYEEMMRLQDYARGLGMECL